MLTGAALSEDKPSVPNGAAAVINGHTYSQADLTVLVEEQSLFIRMTEGDAKEQKKQLAELNDHPVEYLAARLKLLAEFTMAGGSVRPEYVNDIIKNIVTTNFGGDQDKLITALARSGFTFRKFRKMVEDDLTVRVMRERNGRKKGHGEPFGL